MSSYGSERGVLYHFDKKSEEIDMDNLELTQAYQIRQ